MTDFTAPRQGHTVKSHSVKELLDRFLKCRAFGHSWDPDSLTSVGKGRIFEAHLMVRCVSCGTERYDAITWLGHTTGRHYIYPHGYQLSFGLTRAEAKVEFLARKGVSPGVRSRTDERSNT